MLKKQSRILLAAAIASVFAGSSFADVIVSRVSPVNGHVYYVTANPDGGGGFWNQTYTEAEANAASLGGTLVVVNDQDENDWIYYQFSSRGWDMWLGLTDRATEGTWVWSDGAVLGSPGHAYSNWAGGEPNGGTSENMAVISSWMGTWYDLNGTDQRYGLTEKAGTFTAHQWNSTSGGSFGTPAYWTPAGTPGVNDGAYFDLNNTYTVTFGGNVTNLLTVADQGVITFGLGGFTYQQTDLYVGRGTKTASLNLTGGTMTSGYATLGFEPGATGSVSLSNGTWNISKDIYVGDSGTGSVTVNAQGTLSPNNMYLGNHMGATGQLNVSGANAKAMVASDMHVGYSGTGTATIGTGGQLNVGGLLLVGTTETGLGTLSLNGATATIGNLTVGNAGVGTLTATGGTNLNTSVAIIGMYFSGSGNMTVNGDTQWHNTGDIVVGHDGSASLQVNGGADVYTHWLGVARFASPLATFNLTGLGTTLTVDDNIVVGGYGGNGQMYVRGGAAATASSVVVGDGEGGTGYLQVHDSGSKITNTNIVVIGQRGFGVVEIKNGGNWSFGSGGVHIGAEDVGAGILRATGASTILSNPGEVNVGIGGDGSMELSGGVSWTMNLLRIADRENSKGQVAMDSATVIAHEVLVGVNGNGALYMVNNAKLTLDTDWLTIGSDTKGTGLAFIDGSGTVLKTNSGGITVGWLGNGQLQATNGALVESMGNVNVGSDLVGQGSVQVSNGAQLVAHGDLRIADNGKGKVEILNGGVLTSSYGAIANGDPTSRGEMTIIGAGSQWLSGNVEAALVGTAFITVEEGGLIASESVRIGNPGSAATVTVGGSGSKWASTHFSIGNNDTLTSLSVVDGGVISSSLSMDIGYVNVNLADGVLAAPDFWFYSGKTIVTGNGAIQGRLHDSMGQVTASDGTLSIGSASDTNGVNAYALWKVNSGATLEVLDANNAQMSGEFILENGVIIARNGIQASGAPVSGYGVIVGPFSSNLTTPTGVVNLTQDLAIGGQVARVYSTAQATLGPLTTIAGGSLISPKGVKVGANSMLSGYGRVIGNLTLENGVLAADEGQILNISGILMGYGVLVGGVNSVINYPMGTVSMSGPYDIGSRNATVYSIGPADLGDPSLAGGTINAINGLVVHEGISGYGTINANVELHGCKLQADPGQELHVSGTISGYGVLINNVTGNIAPATGTMDLNEDESLDQNNYNVYCSQAPNINATLTLDWTSLWQWEYGFNINPTGAIKGHGTFGGGRVINNGDVESIDGAIIFLSNVTGNGQFHGQEIVLDWDMVFAATSNINASLTVNSDATLRAMGNQVFGRSDGWMNINGTLDVNTQHVVLRASDWDNVNLNGRTLISGGGIATLAYLNNQGTIYMVGSNSTIQSREFYNGGFVIGHGALQAGRIDNAGTMTFSGVTDLLGDFTNESGAIVTAIGVGPTTFYKTVENYGEIHVSQASFAVFLGDVTNYGLISGDGTAIYEAGYATMSSLVNPGNSIVQLPATLKADVIRQNSLTVRGTVQLTGAGVISSLNLLSIESGGTLDVGVNDLAILDGSSLSYATLKNWITTDRIVTTTASTAAASTDHPTVLAILDNLLLHMSSYEGLSLGAPGDYDQYVVKYTYLGDVNFDGVVDNEDLMTVMSNMGHAGEYAMGDANYDGWIDISDYKLIAENIGAGDGTESGGPPLSSVVSVVPEPSTLGLMAMATMGLLGRKRRSR